METIRSLCNQTKDQRMGISLSRERLFDIFIGLLNIVKGQTLDVILQSSHGSEESSVETDPRREYGGFLFSDAIYLPLDLGFMPVTGFRIGEYTATGEQHAQRHIRIEDLDPIIVESALWDFQDLLINDGSTGISIVNPEDLMELQFSQHKSLWLFGWTKKGSKILEFLYENDIPVIPDIEFVFEVIHVHSSKLSFNEQFKQLRDYLEDSSLLSRG